MKESNPSFAWVLFWNLQENVVFSCPACNSPARDFVCLRPPLSHDRLVSQSEGVLVLSRILATTETGCKPRLPRYSQKHLGRSFTPERV